MGNQPKQTEAKKPEVAKIKPYTPQATVLAWSIRLALSKWGVK